jgi:hypothetical protein
MKIIGSNPGEIIIAVSDDNKKIMCSTDGKVWTDVTPDTQTVEEALSDIAQLKQSISGVEEELSRI